MSFWIPLSLKSTQNYLHPKQFSLIMENSNDAESIIQSVVHKVRSEIGSFKGNFLHPNDAFVPNALAPTTYYLVIEAFQAQVPSLKLTEDQLRLIKKANDDLKRVASGELRIEGVSTPHQPPIAIAKRRENPVTGKNLNSL